MWFAWLLIVLYVASSVVTVAMVGKRRGPLTAGTAAFTVLMNALMIWGIAVYFL